MSKQITTSEQARSFSSMTEFVDWCSVAQPEMPEPSSRRVDPYDEGWAGTKTFDDAMAIAFRWPEGAARVNKARASLRISGRGVKREVFMRETGPGAFDMAAIAAEAPRPYAVTRNTNRPKPGGGKIIRVHVNVCASAIVSTDVIERRGAAILSLIAALENAGRRCEIVVGAAVSPSSFGGNGKGGPTLVNRVYVKRAETRLNLQSVAFAISHPAMLRRLFFASWEREDRATRERIGIPGGYGMPTDFRVPTGAIYLGRMYGTEPEWQSPESAAEWVRKTAAEQGVVIH